MSEIVSKDGVALFLGRYGYVQLLGLAKLFDSEVHRKWLPFLVSRLALFLCFGTAVAIGTNLNILGLAHAPTVIVALVTNFLSIALAEAIDRRVFNLRPSRLALGLQMSSALLCPCMYGILEVILD